MPRRPAGVRSEDEAHARRLRDRREQATDSALTVRDLAPTISWHDCAIVAPGDLAFGIGRMFEMISEPSFHATMVFRRLEDAELWLQRTPRGTGA